MNRSTQNKVFSTITIIMIILSFVIIFSSYAKKNNIDVDCVQTREDAIKIAEVICRRVYPDFNYESQRWRCIYNDKESVWVVFFDQEGDLILGGGYPEIHIKKKNAEVTDIFLTK